MDRYRQELNNPCRYCGGRVIYYDETLKSASHEGMIYIWTVSAMCRCCGLTRKRVFSGQMYTREQLDAIRAHEIEMWDGEVKVVQREREYWKKYNGANLPCPVCGKYSSSMLHFCPHCGVEIKG